MPCACACSSDGLSSALIALLQSQLTLAGLPRAETFYASGSAPSPDAMLRELMDAACMREAAAAPAAPASPSASSPPCVSSPAFRRSFESTRMPRILLLAPSAKHAFNHALHRAILAADGHAQRRDSNNTRAHSYQNQTTAKDATPATHGAHSSRASNMASASTAPAAPTHSAPLVPAASSVFGLDLIVPVFLEYTLFSSAVSRIWSSMHRLQAEIETPGRTSAEEGAGNTQATLKLSTYPNPQAATAGSLSLAGHPLVVKHSRIFTALSVHKLQSMVLVHVELEEEAEPADMAAVPPLSRADRSAQLASRNASAVSQAIASLGELRVLSAFSSARQVVFDDSDWGRALASALAQQAPQFAFRPLFRPFHRRMELYAFCIGDGSPSSALSSELILFGSKADLAPLLTLLLNGGRRHHLRLCAAAISSAWDAHAAIDVQHVLPEIPAACLRDAPSLGAEQTAGHTRAAEADEDGGQASELHASRFHGSRVLNGSFVTLATAASDAS